MMNSLNHLSLLSHMEADGLKQELTGKFSEELLEQACNRAEEFNLQEGYKVVRTLLIDRLQK